MASYDRQFMCWYSLNHYVDRDRPVCQRWRKPDNMSWSKLQNCQQYKNWVADIGGHPGPGHAFCRKDPTRGHDVDNWEWRMNAGGRKYASKFEAKTETHGMLGRLVAASERLIDAIDAGDRREIKAAVLALREVLGK